MKLCTSLVAGLLILTAGLSTAQAEVKYWDITGATPGATPGDGIADGTWDGAAANWNTDPTGGAAGAISAWTTTTDDAVFSAGNDVGTIGGLIDGAFITITGTQLANSILIEEGYTAFRGGTADTGAGTVTVNSGAILDIDNTTRLNLLAGKVVLNGGTLLNTNPGPAPGAGSFVGGGGGLKGLEVNGTGIIGFSNDDSIVDNAVSIFFGVITGTGGTTTNGGAGTLIKRGVDQIGIGSSDQDGVAGAPFVHSHTLFTFAKLRVEEGAYRLRNGVTTPGTVHETAFGAVPLAELADAITLDGGGIGSNATVTLHANRGITIGPNGGYFDHGAGAGIVVPGPLSGSGTLRVGSPTSTSVVNVTFTLSHPNNVNTFTGNVVGIRGVLQLNSSLTTPNLSSASPAAPGGAVPGASTVSVAAGQTFTFGSDNASTSFDGNVRGAGTWRKVGSGTTTFTNTVVGGNTHSGDTRIEDGTLSIADPYLANAGDVYLNTGAALDLNFVGNDVIDQLFFDSVAQMTGIWGAIGSGAANETAFLTGSGFLDVTTGASVGLTGDYNEDGTVDAADYVVWRRDIGTQQGYDDWRGNFGATSPGAGGGNGGAGAVPEPSTVALLILGMVGAMAGRRNR